MKVPKGYRIVEEGEYNKTGDLYITILSNIDTSDINNYSLSLRRTEQRTLTEYDTCMFYIRKIEKTPKGNKSYVYTYRL